MPCIRALAIFSALLFAAMAIYTWPLKPSIPAIQLTFTENAFKSILSSWKPEGISIFKAHFLIDFPFLVCYGALGYIITKQTKLFSSYKPLAKSMLALSLPLATAADATENSMHLLFLYNAGPFSQAQYFAAGVAASIKWILIIVFVGNLLYAYYKTAD